MNTKEAIEVIENYVKALEILKEPESKLYTALKKVIPLLQQVSALKTENEELKAYRQMWEALDDKYGAYTVHECYKGYLSISNLLADFKQKYLKEANPDETGKAKDNRKRCEACCKRLP